MTSPAADPGLEALALKRARQAMRLVCAEMPHLAGLAHLVRVKATRYFPVAAVGASGLLAVNPDVFAKIQLAEAAYVMAHELMHLALDTHSRQGSADPLLVNIAHDYIINDLLSDELHRAPPLGGLEWHGAREKSLEQLVVDLSKKGKNGRVPCWATGQPRRRRSMLKPGKSPFREAFEEAGLVPPEAEPPPLPELPSKMPLGDVMPSGVESSIEPDVTPEQRRKWREQVRREAARALNLARLKSKIDDSANDAAGAAQTDPQRGEQLMKALRTAYAPPWQLALQHWLDAVAPAGRTYSRASRRGADRDDDVVLCGRFREGWCLHIVLDTSGSMEEGLPRVLGTIGAFCEAANVAQVHVLQCDIEVTRDEWLEPPQLAEFRIAGFGGSDMSPGLNKLADDPEVNAVLVLTDGYINFPDKEPPYNVLWALYVSAGYRKTDFAPPYGQVVMVDP